VISVLVSYLFASGYNRVCDFLVVSTLTKIGKSGVQFVVAHRLP